MSYFNFYNNLILKNNYIISLMNNFNIFIANACLNKIILLKESLLYYKNRNRIHNKCNKNKL